MTKSIYIISGLGADERVFHNISLEDFSINHVKWIKPQKDELIEKYAFRLLDQIKTQKPILLGLSFGGIIALEIAKHIETEKVVIISSAKTKYEIPANYRFIGKIRLHKILSTRLLMQSNKVTNWFFGVNSVSEKRLLKQILKETDSIFLRWAIDKVARWSNTFVPSNIIHIHGTTDKILLYKNIACDYTVINGGHLMVLNKYKEINNILKKVLINQ